MKLQKMKREGNFTQERKKDQRSLLRKEQLPTNLHQIPDFSPRKYKLNQRRTIDSKTQARSAVVFLKRIAPKLKNSLKYAGIREIYVGLMSASVKAPCWTQRSKSLEEATQNTSLSNLMVEIDRASKMVNVDIYRKEMV